jgi:hypothetical protein
LGGGGCGDCFCDLSKELQAILKHTEHAGV